MHVYYTLVHSFFFSFLHEIESTVHSTGRLCDNVIQNVVIMWLYISVLPKRLINLVYIVSSEFNFTVAKLYEMLLIYFIKWIQFYCIHHYFKNKCAFSAMPTSSQVLHNLCFILVNVTLALKLYIYYEHWNNVEIRMCIAPVITVSFNIKW